LETALDQTVVLLFFKAQSLHCTVCFIHWNAADFPGKEQRVQTLFISSSEVTHLGTPSF